MRRSGGACYSQEERQERIRRSKHGGMKDETLPMKSGRRNHPQSQISPSNICATGFSTRPGPTLEIVDLRWMKEAIVRYGDARVREANTHKITLFSCAGEPNSKTP
jgi:hypothetical protein